MEKLGRNDLCPCGSGKKYKECCMEKELQDDQHPGEESSRELLDRIIVPSDFEAFITRELIATPPEEKDREQAIYGLSEKYSTLPHENFLGLTPALVEEIMTAMTEENGEILALVPGRGDPGELTRAPLVAACLNFMKLLEEKGSLPGGEQEYLSPEILSALPGNISLTKETWTPTEERWVEKVRAIPQIGELITLRQGTYRLTHLGRMILEKQSWGDLYENLFYTYADKYSWNAAFQVPEDLGLLQDALILHLHMLKKKAGDFIPLKELYTQFLKVFFPLKEVITREMGISEEEGQSMLTYLWGEQFIFGFCRELGLIEIEEKSSDPRIRVTPLFERVLSWGV